MLQSAPHCLCRSLASNITSQTPRNISYRHTLPNILLRSKYIRLHTCRSVPKATQLPLNPPSSAPLFPSSISLPPVLHPPLPLPFRPHRPSACWLRLTHRPSLHEPIRRRRNGGSLPISHPTPPRTICSFFLGAPSLLSNASSVSEGPGSCYASYYLYTSGNIYIATNLIYVI